MALLASVLDGNRKRHRVAGAIGAVVGAMALDVLCYRQLTASHQ